jgi:hypothetical protein
MKYMLIMNAPRDGYAQYMKWPRKLLEDNATFMQRFTAKLQSSGELVETLGLASPEQALRVRQGDEGFPITDGIFPESKEYLAGYWIIDVDSHERAVQIAAEASTAPGAPITGNDGGTIDHLWIELRRVMESRNEMT